MSVNSFEGSFLRSEIADDRQTLATLTNELRGHERAADALRRDIAHLQARLTDAIDKELRLLRSGVRLGGPQSDGLKAEVSDCSGKPVPTGLSDGARDGVTPKDHQGSQDADLADTTGWSGHRTVRPRRSDETGQAPSGFAHNVRRIAHRSIAQAGRPLERAEIIEDIKASGVPLPENYLPQKISRVLARDEDLINKRGEGYHLTDRALHSELAAMRR